MDWITKAAAMAMALEPTMDSDEALDLADDLHPICVDSMGPSEAVYRFFNVMPPGWTSARPRRCGTSILARTPIGGEYFAQAKGDARWLLATLAKLRSICARMSGETMVPLSSSSVVPATSTRRAPGSTTITWL